MRNRSLLALVLNIVLLTILAGPALSSAEEEKTYRLAVIPNLPAVTIHKNWTPFVGTLSKQVGIKIELKIYDKINDFLEDAKAGKTDFLYSSPNMFFLAHQKQKYIPLVRSSNMMRGVVFVRKDSPYSKIKDLKGKTIAFVGPKTICSVITRHSMITGQGALDYNVSFSGSTINVAKSVLVGKADAGATLDTSMIHDLPEMEKEFRILLETEKVAPHPLAAHPRVPKKIQQAVTAAVLAMDKTEEGRRILQTVKLSQPIKADFKRDYSFFGEIDFDRLEN